MLHDLIINTYKNHHPLLTAFCYKYFGTVAFFTTRILCIYFFTFDVVNILYMIHVCRNLLQNLSKILHFFNFTKH